MALDEDDLADLLGPALEPLLRLPARMHGAGGDEHYRLLSCCARRYSPAVSEHDQPWTSFHFDAAAMTVNVALSPKGSHEGGELLAVFGNGVRHVARDEGEATAHSSSLLHGVSRITRGVRYSLIMFFGHA